MGFELRTVIFVYIVHARRGIVLTIRMTVKTICNDFLAQLAKLKKKKVLKIVNYCEININTVHFHKTLFQMHKMFVKS